MKRLVSVETKNKNKTNTKTKQKFIPEKPRSAESNLNKFFNANVSRDTMIDRVTQLIIYLYV
jgi:hypothetical protein